MKTAIEEKSIAIGKYKKLIAVYTKDIVNAKFIVQEKYALTMKDRAEKSLDLITSGANRRAIAKFFQTGECFEV